jgi:hypothetical protein
MGSLIPFIDVDEYRNHAFTPEPYIGCPYPCPWVLGGHGCDSIVHGWAWASFLCIHASSFKSESNFSDARNTLTKKHFGLKPTTMNNLLFV